MHSMLQDVQSAYCCSSSHELKVCNTGGHWCYIGMQILITNFLSVNYNDPEKFEVYIPSHDGALSH